MNIFRLCGDMAHLSSIMLLLLKIHGMQSCQGISLKTQELYALVFFTRYLDLFTNYVSLYNTLMKLVFLIATFSIVYRMRYDKVIKVTYERESDSFPRHVSLVVPCLLLAVINHNYGLLMILWAFSIFLEAVAALPQLILLQQTRKIDKITANYVVLLGSYRAFYILNWIYRYFTEPIWIPAFVWVSGLVQTGIYCVFFWNCRHSSVKVKEKSSCSDPRASQQLAGKDQGSSHWLLPLLAKRKVLRKCVTLLVVAGVAWVVVPPTFETIRSYQPCILHQAPDFQMTEICAASNANGRVKNFFDGLIQTTGGTTVATTTCPKNCSGNGQCILNPPHTHASYKCLCSPGWAGPVCEGQVAEDLVTPCHYDEMTYAHGRGTSGLGIVQPGHWKYLILSILDPNNSTVCSDNNGNGIDNDFGDPDQKARCWARLHARPLLFNLAAQHRWEKKTVWDWYSRSGTVLEPFYNDQAAKKQGIDSRNMSGDHCCDSNLETFFIVKPFDPATSVGENFFLDSQAIVLTPGKVQLMPSLTEPFDHVLVAVYNNGHLPVNIHVDAQLGHKPLALPLMWYIIHNIRPVIWPGGKHFMAATIAVVALYLISRKISSRFQAARARAPSVQPFGPKLAGTEHGNCTSIETPFKACMGHLGEEAASAGDRTAADAEGYRGSTPGLPGNNVAAADKESCMHDGSAACMNSRNVAIVFASEEALLVEK